MKSLLLSTVAAAILVAGAFAQNSEAGKRRENQQDRVAQGLKSGQLTAGETSNLEKKEAAINQEVKTDRRLNGGKLTNPERKIVNQQQNQMNQQIYKDKHNAATSQYGNNQVGARRENQQDRSAGGIASDKLSAGQAARLENGQSAINQEVRTDQALNGGKLTSAEKKQVNAQQDQASKRIYSEKHK